MPTHMSAYPENLSKIGSEPHEHSVSVYFSTTAKTKIQCHVEMCGKAQRVTRLQTHMQRLLDQSSPRFQQTWAVLTRASTLLSSRPL